MDEQTLSSSSTGAPLLASYCRQLIYHPSTVATTFDSGTCSFRCWDGKNRSGLLGKLALRLWPGTPAVPQFTRALGRSGSAVGRQFDRERVHFINCQSDGDCSCGYVRPPKSPTKRLAAFLLAAKMRGLEIQQCEVPIVSTYANLATRIDAIAQTIDGDLALLECKTGYGAGRFRQRGELMTPFGLFDSPKDTLKATDLNRHLLQLATECAIVQGEYEIPVEEAWLIYCEEKETTWTPLPSNWNLEGVLQALK